LFFQAEDGIRDRNVTGVQTCALPISVAFEAGKPLSIETVQLEGPKEGEVLVEVKATGICHTDAFTLSGDDPEGEFPAILGHEGADRKSVVQGKSEAGGAAGRARRAKP